MKRNECGQRVKDVQRDYELVLGTFNFISSNQNGLTQFKGLPSLSDLRSARKSLEETYIVRLFSVFEQGLRLYWAENLRRTSEPPVSDIMSSLRKKNNIPDTVFEDADKVRELRNDIVHEGLTSKSPISIKEAMGHLCEFLSRLR